MLQRIKSAERFTRKMFHLQKIFLKVENHPIKTPNKTPVTADKFGTSVCAATAANTHVEITEALLIVVELMHHLVAHTGCSVLAEGHVSGNLVKAGNLA